MNEPNPFARPNQHWIDRAIQAAHDAGAFENLPTMGKPIPGMGEVDDENWWLKAYLKREGLSVGPPSLEIRRVVERGLDEIDGMDREDRVRAKVDELNEKIRRSAGATVHGPASTTRPLDTDEVVARWRSRRSGPR